jgi:Bacterial TSP3 repeat
LRISLIPISISLVLALSACDTDKTGGNTGNVGSDTAGDGGEDVPAGDDADEDTILDIHEGEEDYDGDGTPNYLDTDSDGDGINDKREAGDSDSLTLANDSDGDGSPDYLDLDSDNNCVLDADEKGEAEDGGPADSDGDGVYDFADTDNDGDGIPDTGEIGDDCAVPDTDGDGTSDYMDVDSDGDGINDVYEAGTTEWNTTPADEDEDGTPDYRDLDSDDDGISDADESGIEAEGDEPRDSDNDGYYDFEDSDSDGDGISDREEWETYGTDPYDFDTDGDGFSDGGELAAGTDPLDTESVIDGLYVEVPERTSTEEEFEFELRIQMGDIAFLIDTTCSMSGTANAMAGEFSTIVETLSSTIPDAEYGVATYDDYPYGSYGSAGSDKPFELRQQITDDLEVVADALSREVQIHSGADGPESSMEAIYQGATGDGYDQDCSASYDANYDVKPFLAASDDPFSGGGGEFYDSGNSGGGTIGGFGFREYALPVLVYATDNYLRDPENGYGAPGGCPLDAGYSDVVSAVGDLGAYLIGIAVNGNTATPQMKTLSDATSSYADTDEDGVADDQLVFNWSGSDDEFRTTITGAIEDLVNSITFDKVELEVEGDTWGFVSSIEPPYYEAVADLGVETLEFTLEFRGVIAATTEDQLFKLTLNVIGDETVLLDSLDIIVLVPGTSY